ncbi:MAG: hypothetical protein K0Q73_8248 [Paenibacillus sp.]|nr:hypothetical protein [Paenibacillus sp.]
MLKKIVLISVFLLLLVASQALAEDSVALNIELQLDNESVTINGVNSTVEPPYRAGDTTLVPLRVVTSAFGAVLQWDGTTQTIVLKYGEKQLKLVIGSKLADVNGVASDLPEAPELKNDTTMVPIRFISEHFGAEVKFDSATSKITITGTKSPEAGKVDIDIDSDTGKTRIGNSYYNWSMQYPTGLIKDKQNFRENSILFKDAKEEYSLIVTVEEDQDTLSKDGLLKFLATNIKDTIQERRYVDDAKNPYALVVSKTDKIVSESRAYQADDRIYIVVFIVKEELYNNVEKNKIYKEFINSFTPNFDKTDKSLKDLSTVSEGFRPYTNDEFGVTLQIPAEWIMVKTSEWLSFGQKDGSEGLSIRVSSVVEGDTLDAWVKREVQYTDEEYVTGFTKTEKPIDLTVSGQKAKLWKYSARLSEQWTNLYGLYSFKDNLKFEMNFTFKKSEDHSALVERIIKDIKIHEKPSSTRGFIQDDRDFIDRAKTSVVSFKKLKFSLSVPDYWIKVDTEDEEEVRYSSHSGTLSIHTVDNVSLEQVKKSVDMAMKKMESSLLDFKLTSSTTESFAGVTATKYMYTASTPDGAGYNMISYVFGKNNKVYIIDRMTYQATSTELNKKMYEDALKSFVILD